MELGKKLGNLTATSIWDIATSRTDGKYDYDLEKKFTNPIELEYAKLCRNRHRSINQ